VTGEDLIFLNQGRRAIRCDGFLGARLRPGSGLPDGPGGVGDCMLLDFGKGFFAVSDSSDRSPSFSRAFMFRFAGLLEGLPDIGSRRPFSDMERIALQAEVEFQSGKILSERSLTESCTFTGVLILKAETGWQGLVLHTGDSLLLQYDPGAGTVRQVTQNNFWMVGRTSRFFQVEYISLTEQTRLLLATDGFSCLKAPAPGRQEDLVRKIFQEYPVEEVPDILIDGYDVRDMAKDDLVLVSLCPARITYRDQRVILGGTTSHAERSFREEQTAGRCEDHYAPMLKAEAA